MSATPTMATWKQAAATEISRLESMKKTKTPPPPPIELPVKGEFRECRPGIWCRAIDDRFALAIRPKEGYNLATIFTIVNVERIKGDRRHARIGGDHKLAWTPSIMAYIGTFEDGWKRMRLGQLGKLWRQVPIHPLETALENCRVKGNDTHKHYLEYSAATGYAGASAILSSLGLPEAAAECAEAATWNDSDEFDFRRHKLNEKLQRIVTAILEEQA